MSSAQASKQIRIGDIYAVRTFIAAKNVARRRVTSNGLYYRLRCMTHTKHDESSINNDDDDERACLDFERAIHVYVILL